MNTAGSSRREGVRQKEREKMMEIITLMMVCINFDDNKETPPTKKNVFFSMFGKIPNNPVTFLSAYLKLTGLKGPISIPVERQKGSNMFSMPLTMGIYSALYKLK